MNDQEKEAFGQMVGTGIGVASGAHLGSVVIPIPIVGSFTGGLLGAVIGSEIGKRAGKAMINGALAFVGTLRGEEFVAVGRVPELGRGGYA